MKMDFFASPMVEKRKESVYLTKSSELLLVMTVCIPGTLMDVEFELLL